MSPGIRRHARPLAPASSASGRRRGRGGWTGPVFLCCTHARAWPRHCKVPCALAAAWPSEQR
eukprot:15473678-Alexandrium_andersonii.AAC.1